MQCIQCNHAAVALCRQCLSGLCATHLKASLDNTTKTGALSVHCTHQDDLKRRET